MNIISNVETYTASHAREKLYTLIKAVSSKLKAFEITLRGSDPVLLLNKAELEAWQETLDILSNKKEIASLQRALRQTKTVPHRQVKKQLGLNDEASL